MLRPSSFAPVLASFVVMGAFVLAGADCSDEPTDSGVSPGPESPWSEAFDATDAGSVSGVWGTGPDNIYAVGGKEFGTIMHFDGTAWSLEAIPEVPLLVWAYGFGPSDIYAVGLEGTALHYDGTAWTELVTGTDEDLWGVFGARANDVWIVGGNVDGTGTPTLLHWDNAAFTPYTLPAAQNLADAQALFKVWGINGSLFAVGQNGLILSYDGTEWLSQPAGPQANDDFVSLWGTSNSRIVAVGGRGNARVATFDGTTWTTVAPSGFGGINAVFVDGTDVYIGGVNGLIGLFDEDTGEIVPEDSGTRFDIHAIWGDGAGTQYAVGGNFLAPFRGVALVR